MSTSPRHAAMPPPRRRLKLAAMVIASALALVAPSVLSSAQPAQALAKIKCKQTTGTGQFDPIVHHDEKAPVGHQHQFFGNNAWLSLSNPNAANLSAVQAFTAYYRSWDFKDTGAGQPFPPDTRLVAQKHDWSCGQFMPQKPVSAIPDCSAATGRPGSTLTAHIDFPSCWNGVKPSHSASQIGDTNDNRNFAYRVGSSCPAGFPVKMVSLRETVSYTYTGHGTDLELSSDAEHGTTDGQSLHADFWNAWDTAGMASMVRDCVNGT